MGEASMRKWMRRALAELPHDRHSRPRESYVYRTALHMRLRERKRREFWRTFDPKTHYGAAIIPAEAMEKAARG